MTSKAFSRDNSIPSYGRSVVLISQGQALHRADRVAVISEQNYYRWHKVDCGLRLEQTKRLKKLVEGLSLDKAMLEGVLKRNLMVPRDVSTQSVPNSKPRCKQ